MLMNVIKIKFLMAISALLLQSTASAQSLVTWSNCSTIAGSSDVATNGTGILAGYFDTSNPGSYNVNGVTFANNGTLTASGNGVTATLTGNYGVFEGTFNGQTGNYGTILNGVAWGEQSQTLTLSGLTVGGQYLVQFWEVDGRGYNSDQVAISGTASDVNVQTLSYGNSSTPGQWVVGTFTANASTEIFTLNNVVKEVDTAAFQVRSVVNTSSINLVAMVSGNVLSLSWPSDHTGWRLLVQTNNLASGVSSNPSDWTSVSGSKGTNQANITLNPAQPTEFYRLVYP